MSNGNQKSFMQEVMEQALLAAIMFGIMFPIVAVNWLSIHYNTDSILALFR